MDFWLKILASVKVKGMCNWICTPFKSFNVVDMEFYVWLDIEQA